MKSQVFEGNLAALQKALGSAPIVGRVDVDPFAGIDDQGQDALASHRSFIEDRIRPGNIHVAGLPEHLGQKLARHVVRLRVTGAEQRRAK